MIEAFGKRRHLSSGRGDRFLTFRPADRRGDVHRRDQGFIRFWQLGRGACAIRDLQAGGFTTGGEPSGERDDENELGVAHY